jgi:hypothetical protein
VLGWVASPGTLGHEAQETLSHACGVSRPAAVACKELAKSALEVGVESTCLFGEFLQGQGIRCSSGRRRPHNPQHSPR